VEFVEVGEGGDGVRVGDEVRDVRGELGDHGETDRGAVRRQGLGLARGRLERNERRLCVPVSDKLSHQEFAVLAFQHLLVQSIELDRNPVSLLLASVLYDL